MGRQRTAEDILRTGGSFQQACVLTAAAELDVFTHLHRQSATAEALAGRMGWDVRATAIMLDALTGMELLTKDGGVYSAAEEAAGLLSGESSGNLLAMLRHQHNCLRRWSQLADVVKTGGPATCERDDAQQQEDLEAFIGGMHNVSVGITETVLGHLAPLRFDHLLDIGGASGTWTIAMLRKNPKGRATLFDLPAVTPMAKRRLSDEGMLERVTIAAGDYTTDAMPGGADMAWLGAICHQNSRQLNRDLFAKIHRALAAGGRLVIRDVVMEPSHAQPAYGALFAVNMLVATEAGGTYTFDEYREDIEQAGFENVRLIHRDEGMNSLIEASKASS